MRIAVLSRVFSRSGGGAEGYAVALVEQLAQRHEVHVFAQDSNHPVVGVHYHRVVCFSPKPRWINQIVYAVATWWQTRRGFDVVHSHENTWHGHIQTMHVRPIRCNLFTGAGWLTRARQWAKVLLSPRLMTYVWLEGGRFNHEAATRQVVATSEHLRRECQQAYPRFAQAIPVIEPGTNLPQAPLSRMQARHRLGLADNARWVLFVANDYARKGLDALLQAMTLLPNDIKLAVVGKPKAVAQYRQKAEQLKLVERVCFLGSLDPISTAYWAADCLAHPTLEDSFAMVVLEAMAHGLPVVVSGSRYCGISGQLEHARQALLLDDPRDAQALAGLIKQLLTPSEQVEQLKMQARAFAEKHSWQSVAERYEQLFETVTSKS